MKKCFPLLLLSAAIACFSLKANAQSAPVKMVYPASTSCPFNVPFGSPPDLQYGAGTVFNVGASSAVASCYIPWNRLLPLKVIKLRALNASAQAPMVCTLNVIDDPEAFSVEHTETQTLAGNPQSQVIKYVLPATLSYAATTLIEVTCQIPPPDAGSVNVSTLMSFTVNN